MRWQPRSWGLAVIVKIIAVFFLCSVLLTDAVNSTCHLCTKASARNHCENRDKRPFACTVENGACATFVHCTGSRCGTTGSETGYGHSPRFDHSSEDVSQDVLSRHPWLTSTTIVRSLVAHSREASIVIERCQHGSFAEKLWATRFGLVEIQQGDESSAASWFFEQSEGADIFHIYPQDATRQQLLEIRDRRWSRWSLNFVGTSVVFQGEL